MSFSRDNDCNSVPLTLAGATPTAHMQAPGSCPLHTSENKDIHILSRTKSRYGLRHGCSRDTALPSSPSGLQRGVEENSLAYLHELSVKLLLLCMACDRDWKNSSGDSRISFQLAQFR